MPGGGLENASLTLAIAMVTGIAAQSVARHLKLPGLVLLLGIGVVLGPDALNVVRPHTLGVGLNELVGFAVAVILFEGGLNLRLRRLRRAHSPIRRLITIGAVITALGGALCARWILGWDWSLSVLFGTLVIVTGPTVITPLLKRLRVDRGVATVLEAEGVLIDAPGAIVAIVALEVVLLMAKSPGEVGLLSGALSVLVRVGFGTLFGLAGGAVLTLALRWRNVIPEGLENVFTLAAALAIFHIANAIQHESGLAAVTVAGFVVGNTDTHAHRELVEFKEQLTVLLIGMLFVLLAADVRLAEVQALGWPGVITVVALMLVVRPLTVFASTVSGPLSWRQRAFMAWIGPRGIIAAAVASFFATQLGEVGVEGGGQLRALVFLVIAMTVLSAGFLGGPVATWLGLRRPRDAGWVILGANPVGRTLARIFEDAGQETVLLDSNAEYCSAAEKEGLKIIYGNAIDERTLHRAGVDTRRGAIGVTRNEEVNLIFVKKAKHEGELSRLYSVISSYHEGVTTKMLHAAGAQVMFGATVDLDIWYDRFDHAAAGYELWRMVGTGGEDAEGLTRMVQDGLCLPIALTHDGHVEPVSDETLARTGDELALLVNRTRREDFVSRIEKLGWRAA